jgi:hypothetical protein
MAELVVRPPTDPKVRCSNHRGPEYNRQTSKLDHIVTIQGVAINNHGKILATW